MRYWNSQTEGIENGGTVVIANQMNGSWMKASKEVFDAIDCVVKAGGREQSYLRSIYQGKIIVSTNETLVTGKKSKTAGGKCRSDGFKCGWGGRGDGLQGERTGSIR